MGGSGQGFVFVLVENLGILYGVAPGKNNFL